MSLYALKPRFQSLLRPLVKNLHRAGATANQVTVAACLVSILVGIAVALHADEQAWFLLLPAWFTMRMAFNAIDGMLAREFGQATPLGAYLNELTDAVSDAALYLPFAFVDHSNPMIVVLAVFLALVSEFAGVLGGALGASRRYEGPMGKSDRAFVFGALGLTIGLGVVPGAWLTSALTLVCALIAVTTINRVRCGLAEIRSRRDR